MKKCARNESLDINNDTNLIEVLRLDSLGIFNFVLSLEEITGADLYNNNIDNHDITTINNINNFIESI